MSQFKHVGILEMFKVEGFDWFSYLGLWRRKIILLASLSLASFIPLLCKVKFGTFISCLFCVSVIIIVVERIYVIGYDNDPVVNKKCVKVAFFEGKRRERESFYYYIFIFMRDIISNLLILSRGLCFRESDVFCCIPS